MTRTKTIVVVLTALVVLLVVVAVAAYVTRDTWTEPEPEPAATAAPQPLKRFYSQKLSWSDCGPAHCSTVKVPIDYDEPDGGTTRIRVAVHPADGGKAERSIFVNPGGPGGSAIGYAATMASQLGDDVREMYDVVGVDPRGVGKSSPLECLPDQEFDAFTATDPDPDDDAEVTALRDSVTTLGKACRQSSGELAEHVSTVEVAKDMDVVRALLGRAKLDWFGASYGTSLGAVYAELFPERVGRMVLDGAVDPSLDSAGSALGQATGFQRAIDAYAEDCVKRSGCPLGDDPKAGLDRVADLMRQLDQQPMKAEGDRELTEGQAFYGVAVTLYDETTWPYLTRALEAAFAGNGAILLRLSDAYFERSPDGDYANNQGQVIYAVNCLDAAADDTLTVEEIEKVIPRFEKVSPVFGRSLAWGALGCTDWPLEATNPLPEIDAEGAPPIVVLGTTRDPATPYEWAKALASQLSFGVLVTREGDGHTAYGSGNACITDAVDTFLTEGTVPKDGLTCR